MSSRPRLLELERGWDGRLSPGAGIPDPRPAPSSPVLKPSPKRRSPTRRVLADSPYAKSAARQRPVSSPSQRAVVGSTEETDILLKIQERETLLAELRRLLSREGVALSEAGELCLALRRLSLEVVLAVLEWQGRRSRSEAFLFRGSSYLLKLHSDLDMLEDHPALLDSLNTGSARSNPFLLRRLDDRGLIDGGIIDSEASGLSSSDLARYLVAENAVYQEVLAAEGKSKSPGQGPPSASERNGTPSSPPLSSPDVPPFPLGTSSGDRSGGRRRRRKRRLSPGLRAKRARVRVLLSDVEELRGKREEVDERVALLQSELRLIEAKRRNLEAKRVAAIDMRKETSAYKLGLDVCSRLHV